MLKNVLFDYFQTGHFILPQDTYICLLTTKNSIMSTNAEAYKRFTEEMGNLELFHHEELYHAITDYLGPSIHQNDASKVACSDPSELKTVKESFLIGKLGMEDTPYLDEVIEQVCGAMGESNRNKHRATFYYLLVGILKKESVFLKA